MSNENNNSDFARDLMGFIVMAAVIGGPSLAVAWAIIRMIIAVLF